MQLIKTVSRWGVSEDLSEDIQDKVVLANKINLILIIANLLLFPITLSVPSVFALNVFGIVIVSSSLIANSFAWINLSRFVTANYAMITVSIAHGIMLPPGQAPIASNIALCMAVVPLAFVLFASTEWKKIVTATAVNFIFFLSYPLWSLWLYTDADYGMSSDPLRQIYSLVFSFLTMSVILYLQLRSNRQMRTKNQQMVDALRQNQEETDATQQELQRTLEEVQQARREDEKRNWASEGLAQATRLLREHEDMRALCDHLISYIVKYLDANQGGLFVLEEKDDEQVLELYGCFAYDRKKYLQKSISVGEGLVGQAYLEKDYTYMTEIPPEYVNITSGLGKAAPTSLLVMPMIVNDTVEGVIEMASFREFAEHEITFLKNLGETIASSLRSTKTNAQTRVLLETSRQQAEEMRATEEEMRQNMEELQATQEETHRKEQEYLRRIEELEQQVATDQSV